MSRLIAKPCLLGASLWLVAGAYAQTSTPAAITPMGIATAPSYGSFGFEQYNPFNGYLNAALPLHHIGGRGEAGFDLVWNLQPGWLAAYNGIPGANAFVVVDPYPSNNIAGAYNNAYAFGGPGAVYVRTGASWKSCNGGYGISQTVTSVIFVTPNGSQVTLTDTNTNGAPESEPANACTTSQPTNWNANRGTSFRSTDNSQIQFNATTNVLEQNINAHGYGVATVSGKLVFPNGVTYTVANSNVTQIEDRNGNVSSLTYSSSINQNIDWYLSIPALTQVTDSLNRLTTINYNDTGSPACASGCLTITYSGSSNFPRVVTVITGPLASNLRSDASAKSIGALFPNAGQPTSYNFNPTVASSVILPDGSAYTFKYNEFGELARIILPTTGIIEYDYQAGSGTNGGYLSGNGGVMIYRRLQTRREYAILYPAQAPILSSTGNYTVTSSNNSTQAKLQVFDPNNNNAMVSQEVHTMYGSPTDALTYNGTSCNAWNEGLENQTDYGTPSVMTVVNTYSNAAQSTCMSNPQLTKKVTTMNDTSQKSESDYILDTYGNITNEKDYDWNGTLLRELATTYLYQSNGSYSATNLNLVHLPSVMDTNYPAGTHIAESVFHYDEASPSDAPGISPQGHDNSSHGTGFTLRGNVTSSYQWFGTNGTFFSRGFLFDIAGNVVQTQDPNGNVAYLTYNDDGLNEYAYPTKIKNPLGQATHVSYDYSIGKPLSVIDPNGNTTSYAYNDLLDRLTQTTLPTGAQTNITYINPVWTAVNQDQTSAGDRALQTQSVADGFGRTIEQRTIEGTTSHLIAMDVGYDAAGRISWQSNPSRIYVPTWSQDGLGYGTFFTYDSIGRVVKSVAPDGGITTTSYSGNAVGRVTTVTDPAGHARQNVTDALGRLTSVIEDSNGSPWTTQYAYDALGDLTWVNKCAASGCPSGQGRLFNYDSLGRLTSTLNPESGGVFYTYDANSNLKTRLDSRNLTTTYSYDALNRVTGNSHSDGVTPNVSYSWDTASNGIGHLANAATYGSALNYTSYDAAGHLKTSNQQSPSYYYPFSYNYDLSGALTSETYPSGRVISTGYDGAGRPATVSSSGNSTPYVGAANYWPHGAPYYFQYRNNVWPVNTFTKDLQPSENYSTVGNNPDHWLLYLVNSWLSNGVVAGGAEGYGGSVTWGNMSWFNQTYQYDRLNRLTSAQDTGWSRTFAHDEYGNMSVTSYNSGVPFNPLTPVDIGTNPYNAANNRLLSAGYDAGGNITQLGSITTTYDDEGHQTQTVDSSLHIQANYFYDPNGQRVQKTLASGSTLYVHDAFGNLAAEYNTAAATPPPCTTCYLSYDGLGSVRLVTDQNAAVIYRHDFLPFGEDIQAGTGGRGAQFGQSTGIHQEFTGQERDTENYPAVDYFNARYMSAVLGSFMSPDPGNAGADITNPQSWNAYAYVLGNPLGLVDPSGMACSNDGSDCQGIITPPITVYGGPPDPIALQAALLTLAGKWFGLGGNSNIPTVSTPTTQTLTMPPNNGRQPNKITCGTFLPNGRTVGSYINQLSSMINDAIQSTSTQSGPSARYTPGFSPLSIPGKVYSGTNFRSMFGKGAGYTANAFLGDAGNFAYATVSANIGVPYLATELAAAGYSWTHHPSSDWVGPYGMDPSATLQVPAGYGASCKGY